MFTKHLLNLELAWFIIISLLQYPILKISCFFPGILDSGTTNYIKYVPICKIYSKNRKGSWEAKAHFLSPLPDLCPTSPYIVLTMQSLHFNISLSLVIKIFPWTKTSLFLVACVHHFFFHPLWIQRMDCVLLLQYHSSPIALTVAGVKTWIANFSLILCMQQ